MDDQAMRTREKILQKALALFNQRGESNVSLAQIAAELDISEGNLWYHFRTKRELIGAHLDELEQVIEANLQGWPGDPHRVETYGEYVRQCFRNMWAYRFLYQAHFDPVKERELAARRLIVTTNCHHGTERLLNEMVRCKLLDASPAEVAELATATSVIERYWFDYQQERYGVEQPAETDLQAGVRQVFALYRPYLSATARAQMAAAAAARKAARGLDHAG
jgi:AcrR family transcriptional regulator